MAEVIAPTLEHHYLQYPDLALWICVILRHNTGKVFDRTDFSSAFPLPSVLFVLLWPLAVYHRLGHRVYLKLEPALQRLDFSVRGYMISKQREKQRKFLEGVSGPSDADAWYLNPSVKPASGRGAG